MCDQGPRVLRDWYHWGCFIDLPSYQPLLATIGKMLRKRNTYKIIKSLTGRPSAWICYKVYQPSRRKPSHENKHRQTLLATRAPIFLTYSLTVEPSVFFFAFSSSYLYFQDACPWALRAWAPIDPCPIPT